MSSELSALDSVGESAAWTPDRITVEPWLSTGPSMTAKSVFGGISIPTEPQVYWCMKTPERPLLGA